MSSRIKKNNEKFAAMTPAEKRVAIARDVLEQLKVGRLIATTGIWVEPTDSYSFKLTDKNAPVESLFCDAEGKIKCEVCGLGSLFVCAMERFNKKKIKDLNAYRDQVDEFYSKDDNSYSFMFDDENDIFGYLKKFFTKSQLYKIESAFEQGGGATYDAKASTMYAHVDEENERMRLIMENIIVNNGTFVVSEKMKLRFQTPGFNG